METTTCDEAIAQVALDNTPCDLCSSCRDVVWWCLECQELLCDNCKKTHLRSKVSKHHQIVHNDIEPEIKEKTINYIFCNDHPDDILTMFCKVCLVPVCQECMIGSHNAHKLDKIDNAVQQQKTELCTLMKQIQDNKEATLKEAIKNTENYMQKTEVNHKNLKQTSDEINETICNLLDQTVKQDWEYITDKKWELEDDLENLKGDLAKCEENMAANGVKFLSLFQTLTETLEKHISNKKEIDTLPLKSSLHNTNITEVYLRKLVCHLNTINMKIVLSIDISNVFGTITDKCMSPTISSNHIWIGNEDDKSIALLSKDGTLIRFIQVERAFDSLTVAKTGKLLCTYWGRSVIKELSDDKLKDLEHEKISPYQFKCVYRTDSGELLCGVTSPEGQEGSKVILLSEKGKIVKTYQYNSIDKTLLFDDPYCLIQNKNKDIWMVECENSPVKVVDEECRLKFKYNGASDKTYRKFNALGLECDQLGRVLISDKYNHSIHLVDEDGQFLQYIITQQDGILYPTTIMKDIDQNIWVLSEHGKKLYLISYLSKVMTLHIENHSPE